MRRFFVLLLLALPLPADQLTYQKPPKEILDILNAPALPALAVNPTRTYATLSETVRYPSIAEVSAPMLRLAGIRIDPRTNGLHLAPYNTSITLIKLPEATKMKVALPPGERAALVARRQAVRVHQHHRRRTDRALARRSGHRQNTQDRKCSHQRRPRRADRVAAR